MNRIFTILSLCLLSIAATAQEYVFTDKNGSVYDDGAVINRTEVTDDGFGGLFLPADLFVKKVGAAEGTQVAIQAEITKIDNGSLQLCFPTNCQNYTAAGTYEPNGKATLAVNESKDLETEWVPEGYGECTVTYTAKSYQPLASEGTAVRTITVKYKYADPAVMQNWWGYVNGNESFSGVGVNSADTYHCAIYIPGNHAIAAGKTINAVRFGLVAPHATNAKVWVASDLPVTVDASHTLSFVDVPESKLGNEQIDIELPSAIEIPAEGIYVGYSFTITSVSTTADQYPVLFGGEPATNTLILKTDKAVTTWSDLVSNNFGRLFLQVLLEGTFPENTATASDFGPVYVEVDGTATVAVPVMNAGGTPISNIDYTITSDGVTGAEQHAVATTPIVFNTTGNVDILVQGDAVSGTKTRTINITKINGQANANANVATSFVVNTLSELVARNVAVEENTGTGCGWCPRGLIGMDKLRENFGDRFVGIGIHQYNSGDAMYIAKNAYASLNFEGAPSCRIDRGAVIDPYYGTRNDIIEDFRAEMAIPALAKVNVTGTIDAQLTKVNAKAEVETVLEGKEYNLEFVVIGDGLKGTGSSWNQSNYYVQYSVSEVEPDLAIFASGGKYGQSSFTGWSFNDVALVSSYVSSKNQVPTLGTLSIGEPVEREYSLKMPTKTTLKNAVKDADLYIIALVVDKQSKKIVNAAKAAITVANPDAIETVNATDDTEVARYTLDGRRVNNAQKGLNIVRMANGKTVKVINK